MDQAEVEALVSELETRVERLRALYDQYFMGIEKLEPLVVKKDVERRLQQLRKEQIKNTGIRFRFQQIVSRYNTFLTYWMRIARQIEEGRFKRHVMRAVQRFGIDPTHENESSSSMPAASAVASERGRDRPSEPPVIEIPDEPIEEIYELDAVPEEEDPFADLSRPAATQADPRFAAAPKLDFDDAGDPFEEADPFPRPAPSVNAPKIRIAPRPGADARPATLPGGVPSSSPPTVPRGPSLGPPGPRPMLRPATQPSVPSPAIPPSADRPPSTKIGLGSDTEPRIIAAKRASIPDELEAAPASARPPVVRPRMASSPDLDARRPATLPSAGVPAVTITQSRADIPAVQPKPSRPPIVQRPATLPSAIAPPAASAPPPATTAAPSAAVSAPPPAASRVISPAAASTATPRTGTLVSSRPVVTAPPPKPAVSQPPAARIGDLSDDRFRQIYSQYVETRRKHNEPTGAITKDALAKQLADSTQRLKQKHGGKSVDFEVVVKDGKTILRPVVK